MTPLAPRQQVIVDLLGKGPKTMRELATACGYEEGDRGGSNYVSVQLCRLAGHGYYVHNYHPRGSHRGAYYVLMRRPRQEATEPAGGTCRACGVTRLNRWNSDGVCWPCQRSRLDVELEVLAPVSLFDAMVTS